MPQVFDNIDQFLLPALQGALSLSDRADFCVGYFNLRGWKELDKHIQHWSETGGTCRLLVGMQKLPQDQLREVLRLISQDQGMDNQSAIRLKKRLAEEFRIPRELQEHLLEFQEAAVRIAAHHLNKRNGVLIGDVVGLGKTLMATALARIFEDDYGMRSLILCPKNLVPMWEDYRQQYGLRGKVLSISRVIRDLPDERRYQLVVIDESHNLRNREGRTYRAVQEYIKENDSHVIMLTATPYNKTYLDLSNQLRLFMEEDLDIGIRPEQYLSGISETEFLRRHQCSPRTLAAFENSEHPDDWRDLMRLYLVRRTRSFIQENYAKTDENNHRRYLEFPNGTRSYFPARTPRTVRFEVNDQDPDDQYARLYSDQVVDTINDLALPRYGLGNYIAPDPDHPPTPAEQRQLQDLS